MNFNKFCQSCMLPKDHELFLTGTESDGIKNEFYCSMCYEQGQFLYPEITTAKQMQESVKNVLKKDGFTPSLFHN